MPRKLRYADEAVADLEVVRGWQTQPGAGGAAIRRLKRIRAAIRRLKQTPCLYSLGDHEGLREMPCEGYRVIYRVDPDTGNNDTAGEVLVLRVFGPGQAREAVVHGHARRTLKFPIRR